MKRTLSGLLLLSSTLLIAEGTFTLGEISISAKQQKVLDVKEISNKELESNPEKDIAKVLDRETGISIEHKGGREESSLMIRGLEASRTGIFIDGIPIYVPYDGNFDYSRILSTDLDSVNIAKGFSSTMFGPNTMSGVVNFITKKPTKEFEGTISSQINFDNDFNQSQWLNTLNLGTKKEKYYFQFNGTSKNRDHWSLSDDYTSTALQSEGERDHSDSDSKSFNLKAGYTPDNTSEYVLGFNYLNSQKSQPTVVDSNDGNEKYIDWPTWDSNSLYFIANKKFDTKDFKFKLYRTSYKNTYEDYKDGTWSTLNKLEYTDAYSLGSGLEYSEYGWSDEHIVKFALNLKKDNHEIKRATGKDSGLDDKFVEEVYSVAVEDIYEPNDNFKIITSLSYDYANPTEAITYDTIVETKSNDSYNGQLGFFYDFKENQTTRFTIARKTHLPTLKERFSDKKGKALINPDLEPEKATHFELGHKVNFENIEFDTALFLIDVKDPIRIVNNVSGSKSQEQNTGKEQYKGFETSLKYIQDLYTLGFNYTYTSIEKDDGSIVVTDVPKHSAYFFADYTPTKDLKFSANMTYKKDLILEDANSNYVNVSNIKVIGVNADYKISKDVLFSAGVTNLTDENYELDLGYPEPGREYYVKLTYKF